MTYIELYVYCVPWDESKINTLKIKENLRYDKQQEKEKEENQAKENWYFQEKENRNQIFLEEQENRKKVKKVKQNVTLVRKVGNKISQFWSWC